MQTQVLLRFWQGGLLLQASQTDLEQGLEKIPLPVYCQWDARMGAYRSLALFYRDLLGFLQKQGILVQNEAKNYPTLSTLPNVHAKLRPYQQRALDAWQQSKRALLELPTGAGKTIIALAAIAHLQRGTLVVTPTLDLMAQWAQAIEQWLEVEVGLLGGGSHTILPVTVTTYASALRWAATLGNQFGLVVFDECHHLSSTQHSAAAEMLLAPYRLGLSATMPLDPSAFAILNHLVGPLAHRETIANLQGVALAPYQHQTLYVHLSPAEHEEMTQCRQEYLHYLRAHRLRPSSAAGWQRVVQHASTNAQGRAALAAHRKARNIAFGAKAKMTLLAQLLQRHRHERVLIFTHENALAYAVCSTFLLPIITHHTPTAERKRILQHFRQGQWPRIVSSRVLNEGVDVPEAAVAIVLSGASSPREHIQRLGRILRPAQGKQQAMLYELVSQNTSEVSVSKRRRHFS